MDNQDRNHNYCECVTLYLTDCRGRGLSESTIAGKLSNLHLFFDWCEQHEIHGLRRIHLGVLEAYRNHLPEIRQVINGRPLTRGTQRNRLIAVKMLFRYLAENGLMEEDPAKKLIIPKPHRALPQGALSFEEATVVLDSIQPTNIQAIRDRTLLETFFATGIRRMELANLNKGDINLSNEMLFIKNGKGGKDRYLPIASRACRWISKYLFEARPHLKSERTGEALFLDTKGMRFRGHQLTRIVSEVFRKTGIRHKGSCHVFRHTVARLMLENGADIRYIQEMLGHADISTTQIYTFVAIPKLREVYDRTHPAATKDQSHSFT